MRTYTGKTYHIIAACFAAGLSCALLPVHAGNSITIDIPYTQVFTTNTATADDTFEYQITATCTETSSCPLPSGTAGSSEIFTVKGNTSDHLSIIYEREGIYTYEVRAIDAGKAGYTYDQNIYTIEVYITTTVGPQTQNTLIIKNTSQRKVTELHLDPSYYEAIPETAPTPEATPATPYFMVNTGVFSIPIARRSFAVYIIMIILLILFIATRKKRKE